MEIKRVTEDFGSRGEMSLSTLYEIEDIMYMIEMLFDECDAELANAGMPTLGYEKQPIGTMRDHLVILLNYVQHAHPQCYTELDHPLYVGFKNEATQALSEIVLEDITTDNTFEMQKYEEIIDVNGQYYRSSTKKKLTMKDFLGLDAVVPGNGIPVVENVETIGWFTALFRVDYESMGAAVESLDQMLEMYLHGGEFSHKEYHPVGNFVSGLLDVTIIKPFIESIYGKDLITGEKLTDFERGMQLVNAAVGAVTFGQGALALNFAEMSGKEIATSLLKTWALEAVSDMSAYTVGYACDELGMPASVTFLASLATGCSVSVKAGKYVFQDANSNIVKELDADGMQTFLKELDVDLGDVAWGGGKGTNKISIDAYESLLGPMTDEELKRYLKFLEDGSQAGLTPAELMGIRKVDEYLALGRVDYDEVLALRKGVSGGGTQIPFVDMMSPEEAVRYEGYWKWKEVEGTPGFEGGTAYDGWYKIDGTINYPPNDGAIPGTQTIITLGENNVASVGRYGKPGPSSVYVTQSGASATSLSLPPNTDSSTYINYKIVKPIPDVEQATIIPWAGDAGLGTQYKLPKSINWFIDNGYLLPE